MMDKVSGHKRKAWKARYSCFLPYFEHKYLDIFKDYLDGASTVQLAQTYKIPRSSAYFKIKMVQYAIEKHFCLSDNLTPHSLKQELWSTFRSLGYKRTNALVTVTKIARKLKEATIG